MILNVGEATVHPHQSYANLFPAFSLFTSTRPSSTAQWIRNPEPFADFMNEMRFYAQQDLILGNVTEEHKLYHLLENRARKIGLFVENSARIDVIGFDYYRTSSELEWSEKGRIESVSEGFCFGGEMDYVNRFNLR